MTRRRTVRRTAAMATILAAAAMLTAGCELLGIPIGSPGPTNGQAALAAARARWVGAGIDDYEFTIGTVCFCQLSVVGPFRVVVTDGATTDVVNLEGGPVDDDTRRFVPLTVDGLFAKVGEALAGADALTVTYDPDLGYPTRIDIDWIENAVDDEAAFEVRDFTRTP